IGMGGVGTGSNNVGFSVFDGAAVTSTGNASITISGKGGPGSATDNGVEVLTGGLISAQGSALSLTGSTSGPGDAIKIDATTIANVNAGTLTLTADQNVKIADGAMVSTVNGPLTILANQGQTAAAGNFWGIEINGAMVETTGTGAMRLAGRGGADIS